MRLLVVEDEEDLAEAVRLGLVRAGYAVDVAGDAAQAYDRLAVNAYDLMLLDINLPDADEDLAVLEVDGFAGLPPATRGRSADRSGGEQVLAIGSPLGLSGTVTAGIVSALDREVRLGGSSRTAVQTDASINPGNSGGPLVNGRGEVVGVNTAIASGRGGGNIGIGFAIPIDRAAPIAERILRN